jgi:N-acetylmuramoyl-L-alanine amidase
MDMNRKSKRQVASVLLLLSLLLSGGSLMAAELEDVRMWRAPDHTRLVFDLSGPITYSLFTLDNPNRVVF